MKKTQPLRVRISDSEKEKIEEIKEETGLSTSEIIRKLINENKK